MKKAIYTAIVLACLSVHFSFGQYSYDTVLIKQLNSIIADDQRYRLVMTIEPGSERDSIAKSLDIASNDVNDYFGLLQRTLDSINLMKVEAIIHKVGYPGKTLVGHPANEAAYYVIQHSDKIKKYFPLIEQAGKKGEIPFMLVAMMQDRMLKEEGKEQIYGTQYAGFANKDPVTHEQKITWFLWPVKDYAHVNERRKKAGFTDTIAENAADQGIPLNVVTLTEARKKYPDFFATTK